jgi:hypothetical protein
VRNTFIALLLVNLVYLAWSHWVDAPETPAVNEALSRLPRLKLLSELPPEQRPTAVTTRTALNETPGCVSVGPFGDIPTASRVAGILDSKGFALQQRAEETRGSEGFWVFVDGLKNEADADRARVKLENGGIRDALVMPGGGNASRRVSLGLFTDRPQAEQRAREVKRMGFKAEVSERKLPKVVYWVEVAPRLSLTAVPLEDLFAEGLDSRIAVQSCRARPPPSATAAAPLPPAPEPPTAGAPLATQIAVTPSAVAGTAR